MSRAWIALVGPEVEENLSLRYLAGSLGRAGYRAELFAFNREQDFPRIVRQLLDAPEPPLLVGLSLAFQWRAHDFLALAMALREGGYRGHLTAGGHFATFEWRNLLAEYGELDSICRFEAEETVVELAAALQHGRPLTEVRGLALRLDGAPAVTPPRPLPDLAGLAHPDRRGEPALCFGHRIAPLVGSRGCYGSCSFCCIAAWQEQTLPGQRFRLRPVEDVAAEMLALHRERGVEIFVFQDDDFFLRGSRQSLERIHALADALDAGGIGRFATVVKARPPDVRPEVFGPLVERLHCIRAYVGIETDSDLGLQTLARKATRRHNRRALEVVRELGLYICFNLLVFDPDTRLEDLEANVEFMREVVDYPFCVGRVELYAGTPLLERMLRDGRCRGDWTQWDYALGDARVERVFRMTMAAMRSRNFGDASPVVQLWLLRFDLEACRFFHREVFDPRWLEAGIEVTRELSSHTAATMRRIVDHVRSAPASSDGTFALGLADACRRLDAEVLRTTRQLADAMGRAVGHAASLTEVHRALSTAVPLLEASP